MIHVLKLFYQRKLNINDDIFSLNIFKNIKKMMIYL